MTHVPEQSAGSPAPPAPPVCANSEPPISAPFFEKTDWLSFGLSTLICWLVYLAGISPEVTLDFSGVFATGASYAGVAHPPGYPVWTLYSWGFVHLLPFSNIAWRVAIGSSIAAAVACGLTALMVSRGGKMLLDGAPAVEHWKPACLRLLRLVCGYVAAMALGLSSPVWRKAVVAEAWALSLLLFAALLCWLMRWSATPERTRYLGAAFFFFGLVLTSNQELIVAAPGILAFVLLVDHKLGRDLTFVIAGLVFLGELPRRFCPLPWLNCYTHGDTPLLVVLLFLVLAALLAVVITGRLGSEWLPALLCAVLFLLGTAFYLGLPFASMANPPMNWAYPRTLEGFVHLVTRGQYEPARPTDNLARFVAQLWGGAKETGRQFGWLYLLLVPLAFAGLRAAARPARMWMAGLAAVALCLGPLLAAVLNPSPDRSSVELLSPYFSPLYMVLALWTGLGLVVFATRARQLRSTPTV